MAVDSRVDSTVQISTTEMHSAGEPLRIIESGFPEILGETILDKRRYARENLDHLRRFLIFEPRGHHDMYGALLVKPDLTEADLGVLFIHNEGYSTMCGHAMMCLGRYAVDKKMVKQIQSPETEVNIQCPCGLVKVFVEFNDGKTGRVRFHSVPAFAFATDLSVEVPGYGEVTLDIGYGGAFYAILSAEKVGLDMKKTRRKDLVEAAATVSDAVRQQVKLHHPDNADLAYLYGTILTDGKDVFSSNPTANLTVFADREVDRAPTGSGVTARVAVQYAHGLLDTNQCRAFESAATGGIYTGRVIRKARCGEFDAVVVEVSGTGYYSGSAVFTAEDKDDLKAGFLLH